MNQSADVFTIDLLEGQRTTAMRHVTPTPAVPSGLRIVLAHGAGAGQRHPFIVGIARRLAATGIEVWTFNFPYMEQNRRMPDRAPALEACFRRVIAHVRDSSTNGSALLVGGKSMGGRIATHLAAQGDTMDGVFALGYPLHPPGRPQEQRARHLSQITAPVLIVQGSRDGFGTPAELAPVIATMTARVTLEIVPGGDHSLGVRGQSSDQLHERVANLIESWSNSIRDS